MASRNETEIDRLIDIMAALRHPETGCPWDIEQDFATIAPYTIEEAYEVAEAIRLKDMGSLRDELGDLLFQVVYHARMAEESGDFVFADVAEAISAKMIRRHPHVFGTGEIADAEAQTVAWEEHKAQERAEKAGNSGKNAGNTPFPGVLDDVPLALPALTRAEKLTKRAGRVGFDWPDIAGVMTKIREELGELETELDALESDPAARERAMGEYGDLLFALANLGRKMGFDSEEALRRTNAKFEDRFHHIEARLRETGRGPADSDLAEMDALWNEAKALEPGRSGPGSEMKRTS